MQLKTQVITPAQREVEVSTCGPNEWLTAPETCVFFDGGSTLVEKYAGFFDAKAGHEKWTRIATTEDMDRRIDDYLGVSLI